jgi:hypothetical protein
VGRRAAKLPEFIHSSWPRDAAILSLDANEVQLLTVDHDLHHIVSENGV